MAAKITLKTIAERTGLSVPTVSQILNNRSGNYSSARTREKVMQAARELHYRPNFGYQLMHGKKTGTVAMVFPSERFYNEQKHRMFQTSLMFGLARAGYNAYVTILGSDVADNLEQIRNLIHRGVEQVILHGHPFGVEEIIKELSHAEINFIGTHKICPRYVDNGSFLGRKRILEYIIKEVGEDFKLVHPGKSVVVEQGHIRALCSLFPDVPLAELEKRFILKIDHPADLSADWVKGIAVSRETVHKSGYKAMDALQRSGKMPRAVIFSNDTFAIGGGIWLLEKGHEQFRDRVILAGYNNDAELNSFPLPIISGEDDVSRQTQLLITRCGDTKPCEEIVPPRVFYRRHSEKNIFPGWDCEVEQL